MNSTRLAVTHCYLTDDKKYVAITYDRGGVHAGRAIPRKEFEDFLAAENELDWKDHKEVLGIEEWFLTKHEPGHRFKVAATYMERLLRLNTPDDKVFKSDPFNWLKQIARPTVPVDVCPVQGWAYNPEISYVMHVTSKHCGVVEVDEISTADFGKWLASKGVLFVDWYNPRITSFEDQKRSLYNYLTELNQYYHDLAHASVRSE